MFTCSSCKKTVGPNISPSKKVIGTRPTAYHNEFYREDQWGKRTLVKVESQGDEILGETLLCPDCSGEPPQVGSSVQTIGGRSFEEKLSPPMKVKLIANVVQGMLHRLGHSSKRAKSDTETVVPNIKQYVDHNKDLVF